MPYKEEMNRDQMMMHTLNDLVLDDSPVRIIDIFIENLDLTVLGFQPVGESHEGRPAYRPQALLKLFIYGHMNKLRSSRNLAHACIVNIEVIWLMQGLQPDFRTISDFRKNNCVSLKKVFHEFNKRISGAVKHGTLSVDGSKFRAVNSKYHNFTEAKLEDRIRYLDQRTNEYLHQLDMIDDIEYDEENFNRFSKEELEEKIHITSERLKRYRSYQKELESSDKTQISLIDSEAKLMKGKDCMLVGYNVQTAVDTETHLIENFEVTDKCTDHGQLMPTVNAVNSDNEIINVVADKGYQQVDDLVNCLENGVVPNVILSDGKDEYDLQTEYEPTECSEEDIASEKSVDLKKCLRSGIIPNAYADCIYDIEVKEIRKKVFDEQVTQNDLPVEKMKTHAQEGFFVRDVERNCVYCPNGETLFQKSITKSGAIRYANKAACRRCPNCSKCFTKTKVQDYQQMYFSKDCLEKPCKKWNTEAYSKKVQERTWHWEKKMIVSFRFSPNRKLMDKRKCTSEHPFGTIKRSLDAGYFLLRGIAKTTGETALNCLAYNLIRGINLLGFDQIMELMMG